MTDVLIINSYAGSLTLAAKEVGLPIRGSYEDAGYGIEIQKANFPEVSYREKLIQWPEQNLSETIVLAHPPCSAFSQQNTSKAARGTAADKFQCTINVLDYALKNKARALAIESVPAALEGARGVHDEFAEKYGYDVFRICQNAVSFGAPQWRPRFWAIFVKKGNITKFHWGHRGVVKMPRDVVNFHGECEPVMVQHFNEQIKVLENFFGTQQTNEIINGKLGFGSLPSIIKKNFEVVADMNGAQIAKKYCIMGNFMSHCMRILDPRQPATTLLFDSWWVMNGQLLTIGDYCAIMGFPRDYKFPGKYRTKFREFLSRGVCPPVAVAVLRELKENLFRETRAFPAGQFAVGSILPGETLDLQPTKKEFVIE